MLRKLLVVGLVGFVSLATSIATADEATAPGSQYVGASGVSFTDDTGALRSGQVNITSDSGDGVRFANLSLLPPSTTVSDDRSRHYEVSVVARAAANIDVAFAHRRGIGFDDAGDISRQTEGSEVRVGHGLHLQGSHEERPSSTPRWYAFVASDQQALIWRPGARSDFGGSSSEFALQDRVEIGDVQAGVTYEVYGVQTSLAYVERKMRTRVGGHTYVQDDNFAGITVTVRR
ncbi:MAG: hypothetical protein QM759_16745 [Terricaulis sp.]